MSLLRILRRPIGFVLEAAAGTLVLLAKNLDGAAHLSATALSFC